MELFLPFLLKALHLLSVMNLIGALLFASILPHLPLLIGRPLVYWSVSWYGIALLSGILLLPLQMTWLQAVRCPWLHLKWTAVVLLGFFLGLGTLSWWNGEQTSLWQRWAFWVLFLVILVSLYVYKPCKLLFS